MEAILIIFHQYIIFFFDAPLMESLFKFIKEKYSYLQIFISNVRENTAISRFLGKKNNSVSNMVSVSVSLLESRDEFNKTLSKHTKQNLRTALNRMNKDGLSYSLDVKKSVLDDDLIDTLLSMHMKRMITKNTVHKSLMGKLISKYKLFIMLIKEKNNNIIRNSMKTMNNSFTVVVRIEDHVAGYIYGLTEQNGVIRIMQNCIDENYKFYSPMFRGIYDWVLDNCDNYKYKVIDFTRGDEDYKYKLGGKETNLFSYII